MKKVILLSNRKIEFTEQEIEDKVQEVGEEFSMDLHSVNILETTGNRVIEKLKEGDS